MTCPKCLIFSNRDTYMSCQKCLILSTHATQSCYERNVWYSVLMSHRHVMSQISAIQYTCHTDMPCHKWLIFSTHVTKPCHGMSKISDIQYSCHIFMSRHKYLIFSCHVTQSCHVTNYWYSVLMSISHVISYHEINVRNQYSYHKDM